MSKLYVIVGIVLLLGLLVSGYLVGGRDEEGMMAEEARTEDKDGSEVVANREIAVPELVLSDYEGDMVDLRTLVGRPLVINAWATWCPFCVDELPDFVVVKKEFGDQINWVAINRGELESTAQSYTDEIGISRELVFLLDPSDSFYQAIGGFSMPETLFIRADGTLSWHKRGPMGLEEIRQRVREMMK